MVWGFANSVAHWSGIHVNFSMIFLTFTSWPQGGYQSPKHHIITQYPKAGYSTSLLCILRYLSSKIPRWHICQCYISAAQSLAKQMTLLWLTYTNQNVPSWYWEKAYEACMHPIPEDHDYNDKKEARNSYKVDNQGCPL